VALAVLETISTIDERGQGRPLWNPFYHPLPRKRSYETSGDQGKPRGSDGDDQQRKVG